MLIDMNVIQLCVSNNYCMYVKSQNLYVVDRLTKKVPRDRINHCLTNTHILHILTLHTY